MNAPEKQTIPSHLAKDRYWAPLLLLFTKHPKLQRYAQYIDLDELTVNAYTLMQIAKPWSTSEKFMFYLALHLFSEINAQHELNLSDMDRLDSKNRELAFKALQLRFEC